LGRRKRCAEQSHQADDEWTLLGAPIAKYWWRTPSDLFSGETPDFPPSGELHVGSIRRKIRSHEEAKMLFARLLHLLRRRPRVLTIDLIACDRMALAIKIVNLDDQDCATLNWSQDERKNLFRALMVRSSKGYDGSHPGDEVLSAATLALSEWIMVERLCSEIVSTEAGSWPERVLSRIRTGDVRSGHHFPA
jgi:hypothetical protein